MIYLFDNIKLLTKEFVSAVLLNTPQPNREWILNNSRVISNERSILSYCLLSLGLLKEYGIISNFNFSYGEYNKPYLSDFPQIFFNISRCQNGVACAISNDEIGIDIRDFAPYTPESLKTTCTSEEIDVLNNCMSPERLYCKMWTIKESLLKMHGTAIGSNMSEIPTDAILAQLNEYAFMHWGNRYHLCSFGFEKELIHMHGINIEKGDKA